MRLAAQRARSGQAARRRAADIRSPRALSRATKRGPRAAKDDYPALEKPVVATP